MLKNPFIKSAEHYTLKLEHCVLCEDVALFPQPDDDLLRIRGLGQALPAEYKEQDLVFNGSFNTVLGFTHALNDFFRRFGAVFMTYGLTNGKSLVAPINQQNHDRTTPVHFTNKATRDALDQDGNIVSFGIDEDGCFSFKMKEEFFDNCFIELGSFMQKALDLPQFLYFYQTIDGQGVIINHSHEADPAGGLFQANGAFAAGLGGRIHKTAAVNPRPADNYPEGVSFSSSRSIQHIDRRSSLDIVSTLPIARRISVHQDTEHHDQLLARLPFGDFNHFGIERVSASTDGAQSAYYIRETTAVGQEDLTKGSSDTEALHLLPGNIQAVSFGLYCRYVKFDGTITSIKLPIDQGYWSLGMVVIKKT